MNRDQDDDSGNHRRGRNRSLVRKRPVSFGVSRNFHGNVYTLPHDSYEDNAIQQDDDLHDKVLVPPSAIREKDDDSGGKQKATSTSDRRMVAMIGVPPEHVPEGILNLIRSHRPFVEHVRVLIADDCCRSDDDDDDDDDSDAGDGKEKSRKNSDLGNDMDERINGDRTYLILVQLLREEDAKTFVEDLDGKPYISFDDRDKCRIERVVRLETTTALPSTEAASNAHLLTPDFGQCTIARSPNDERKDPNTKIGPPVLKRSVTGMTEIASHQNCAVCLEDLGLDDQTSSVDHKSNSVGATATSHPSLLTTVCNHTFHLECLQQCTGPCPVCRYDHSGLNETLSRCHVCGRTEHNYVCLICGVVSCGVPVAAEAPAVASSSEATASSCSSSPPSSQRFFTSSHAGQHYRETLHAYALDTETQHVYDFCGQGYVYRLVQNKEDGKLVEVTNPRHAAFGTEAVAERSLTPGLSDTQEGEVVHRKLEGAAERYNSLLKSQLEQQRAFYEERLNQAKRECASSEPTEARDLISVLRHERKQVAQRLSSLQKRRTKIRSEVAFLKSTNESLEANKPVLDRRVQQAQRERNESRTMIRKHLPELEAKLAQLMKQLEE
mmetsp:Transcript_7828/g.23013  ORF Transcript_7828/g.23013 Transcript_7828/m.23013 type:complete len:609 (-) Transcript_7828:60-1886(-)